MPRAEILEAHRAGRMTPEATVARSYARIRAHGDPAVFITLRDEADAVRRRARWRQRGNSELPLYGIPVAVKDNIDVAGPADHGGLSGFQPTGPSADATAVARLRQAGAIVIGKTNLDQFATGLVGVRSPYGVPRNPFDPKLIPGGSSSGSAVAVAAGLVPLALGTDTAGSGPRAGGAQQHRRAQAEPRPRLDRGRGAGLPHARLRVGVRAHGRRCVCGARRRWPGSIRPIRIRGARRSARIGAMPQAVRLGVPLAGQRMFFGDRAVGRGLRGGDRALAAAWRRASVEIDIEPFYETARLLYEGPWVAERYITARSLIASAHESMHPVTRAIVLEGARPTRGRCVRGVLPARGAAARARPRLPRDRCAAAADGADRLYGRAGAGRSDRAQQPARHLHQFRQSARSLRLRVAGRDARRTARRSA